MTDQPPSTVTFQTVLAGAGGKTGIEVPEDVIELLGAGHRPAVHVLLDSHPYRSTVAVMGGRHLIAVSAAVRQATGLEAGDHITVGLTVADTPREVDVPADLQTALAAEPGLRAFFEGLSNSLQRYHVDTVNAAKTTATRARRIDKALALFREGKKR